MIARSFQVTLKKRDGAGFPSIVAVEGSDDTRLDDIFGDIVKTACRAGDSSNNNRCSSVKFEADGYTVVIEIL